MDRQTEREYREALDSLRFSGEAKERMMKKLMEENKRPVKERRFRPLRTGLIAACLCLTLVGTAGAATFVVRQANIHFFDSWDELADTQTDDDAVIGMVDPRDYDEFAFMDVDFWWNGEPDQTLVEEVFGADGDGWTAKRTFRQELNGQTHLAARYKAAVPSSFDGLWNGWDTAWLEEHYTAVPGHTLYETEEVGGKPHRITAASELRGQGDTVFSMQYNWVGDTIWGDENFLTTNLDHAETYTTADGVDATIMTATSPSGKTLFWTSVISGHGRLDMYGTQMELDDLHDLLDSLNLSRLVKYTPEA